MKFKKQPKETPPTRRQRSAADSGRMKVSSTFAYSSKRSEDAVNVGRQIDKPRIKPKKSVDLILQRSGLAILALVMLILLINVLTLSSSASIKLLNTSSKIQLTSSSSQAYQAAAKKVLQASVLNDNKMTVDTQSVSNKLMEEFPDLSKVVVTIPLASRHPVIYVEPSQPALVLIEPSGTYEINTNGRAIASASTPQAFSSILPLVTDQSGLQVSLHSQPLSQTYVSFILQVVGQLKAKGVSISQMTLPASSDELDVSIAGQPYFVKFNLHNDDPRQQAGTYLATINYLKGKNITPSKYIDVRLDGRAYYM